MNARIIKETRSLLPVFGVMLLAAVAPPLIWKRDAAFGVATMAFVACAAILGASSLGNEFQWRTLGLLLSQPVSRRRLWLEKMLVLGTAVAIGCLVFQACTDVDDPRDAATIRLLLALVPLVAVCSAPYLTLAVKNTIGAAVLTVVVPLVGFGFLGTLVNGLARVLPRAGSLIWDSFEHYSPAYFGGYALVYCAVFGWLGYRKFMGLQAVESQAQDINLPPRMEAVLARPLRRLVPGYTGPWASLFRKELQLQRASFIIAGLMVALTPLQLLAWALLDSNFALGSLGMNLVICVFVIPLVATGMSVAEERNLGVAGWQFIQPVSAWRQWAAKILVAFFICATLGVALPAAGLGIGKALIHFQGFNFNHSFSGGNLAENLLECLYPVLFYLLLVNLGIYASSVSRTTLQAIIHTITLIGLSIIVTALIVDFCDHSFLINYRTLISGARLSGSRTPEQLNQMILLLGDQGRLRDGVFGIGMALLVLWLGALQSLAYASFRKGEQAANRGRIKFGALVVVISGLVVAMVFSSWIIASMLARIFVK